MLCCLVVIIIYISQKQFREMWEPYHKLPFRLSDSLHLYLYFKKWRMTFLYLSPCTMEKIAQKCHCFAEPCMLLCCLYSILWWLLTHLFFFFLTQISVIHFPVSIKKYKGRVKLFLIQVIFVLSALQLFKYCQRKAVLVPAFHCALNEHQ